MLFHFVEPLRPRRIVACSRPRGLGSARSLLVACRHDRQAGVKNGTPKVSPAPLAFVFKVELPRSFARQFEGVAPPENEKSTPKGVLRSLSGVDKKDAIHFFEK